MTESVTLDAALTRQAASGRAAAASQAAPLAVTVTTTNRIEEVEGVWRRLEAQGIESPGLSYDFIRLWVEARQIPPADQLYVIAALEGRPLALLPLHRTVRAGIASYEWFPGAHVGCGAPLLAVERFAALDSAQRAQFWRQALGRLRGADLVRLRAVPDRAYGLDGLFAELGRSQPTETLYRSVFASWDEANATQRSKSRRKHDRQQGERLEALGAVSFDVVEGGTPEAAPVLAEMFRQRARRFEVTGIADPFAAADIARFYDATVAPDAAVAVKMHVLRLDGAIVAVRYNIVHGDRLFCLISSMSDDPRIQGGSPGKQCLLRVMQTVFDAGFRIFDMGNGFTDEKRHWCNVQVGLATHYVPLTLKGRLALDADALWQSARARIKANPALLKLAKGLRARLHRGATSTTDTPTTDAPD